MIFPQHYCLKGTQYCSAHFNLKYTITGGDLGIHLSPNGGNANE